MATVVRSIGIEGIAGYPIAVQVTLLGGLAVMNIVGLGDQAVKESKDRIESALDHLGLAFPRKKIVINLAPSDIKKNGTCLDLPMLIALLIESEQLHPVEKQMDRIVFLGEVGLSGELNHFRGVLPMVIEAKQSGFVQVVLPKASLTEASRCKGIEILGFETLAEVLKWLEKRLVYHPEPIVPIRTGIQTLDDFSEVAGHSHLLKFVTAAAAGAHNLLLIGPPGCGKSMIAKRIPTILPDLTEDEALEVMTIQSVAGVLGKDRGSMVRPFRSPHYNTSPNAIIGGGANAMPGEISLAHNGVLFLDELPEYTRQTIDALRQPLEDRCVTVARVRQTHTFPASFMLVAAMNPCQCGHFGTGHCTCSPNDVRKYRHRISGPIYDRLDMQKYMHKVGLFEPASHTDRISSAVMKEQVVAARKVQTERFKGINGLRTNSQMTARHLDEFCPLDTTCRSLLEATYRKYSFSARSYGKILCLARTFADLEHASDIRQEDMVSSLLARDLDKEQSLAL
jgi:magnesium chelatase family protein